MTENIVTILDKLDARTLSTCTGSTLSKAQEWLPYFKEVLKSFDIVSVNRVAAFLAQVGHETGGLALLQENLNYSSEGLANTWPVRYAAKNVLGKYIKKAPAKGLGASRFVPNKLAIALHRQPEKIANNCYANRMGNGTETSGEGWKFRGRGLKQVTGKSNYAALTLDTGIDFVSNPDLLLEPAFALISACWFWKKNNLERFADKQDITGLTRAINGGLIGIDKRTILYKKALLALNQISK